MREVTHELLNALKLKLGSYELGNFEKIPETLGIDGKSLAGHPNRKFGHEFVNNIFSMIAATTKNSFLKRILGSMLFPHPVTRFF